MGKSLYIAEKPSVAREFGKALKENLSNHDGYMEGDNSVVTWCVGHLVTMSYPDQYDEKYKKWRLDTLPFLPEEFKYEVIGSASKQYKIVSSLLNREDVERIYVCTDSGREGEYIYRLVRQMASVHDKDERRVWIDSQTEEEILRGIREAKDISYYDNLSAAAYLRAKEDYLMGINFSRLLSIKYGNSMAHFLNEKFCSISVGRVMTCVLGMVVRRERDIRDFVKTPFYRVLGQANMSDATVSMEWKAVAGSTYLDSPKLYKENGFKEKSDAVDLIASLGNVDNTSLQFDEEGNTICPAEGQIVKLEKKKEKKNPPLLYNLAELQNDCSKFFKISPDETLTIIQELYEKKLVTYPRTDARVLSTAVAKEIHKNIAGLRNIPGVAPFVQQILDQELYKGIEKTKYVNDKQITDHYAVIPTGQGFQNLKSLSQRSIYVYEAIVRRFLAIFLPPAEYEKVNITVLCQGEYLFASEKVLVAEGYLSAMNYSFKKKNNSEDSEKDENEEEEELNSNISEIISSLKKGDSVQFSGFSIREGETSPPKRYNSGAMILAMENAGNLIENEELREQIKGSGIGTSATRAEILKKLVNNKYLNLNKKTQIYTPTLRGEMIYDIVLCSIPSLLDPKLTASWEKGLSQVAEGTTKEEEYMDKLTGFITRRTNAVKGLNNQYDMNRRYEVLSQFYKK